MRVRVIRSLAVAATVACALNVATVAAQEPVAARPLEEAVRASAQASLAESSRQIPIIAVVPAARSSRPVALAPLYASYVALQVLDVHSTRRGLAGGASEANPALRGIAGNTAGLVALKSATTAGVIFGTERLARKHRVASVVLMSVLNSAMTFVVTHNYRVGQ